VDATGVDTVGCNSVKVFATLGCQSSSRDYSRQYESVARRDECFLLTASLYPSLHEIEQRSTLSNEG
jgi:hypothetical protein